MNVEYSCEGREDSKPADVISLVLNKYSHYEMTNPLTWHSITPLEETYTVMINGEPWNTELVAHKDVRTTKGKDLEKMQNNELIAHLDKFKLLVNEYLNGQS